MTIAMAWEIDFRPMFRLCVLQQPRNTFRGNLARSVEGFIEGFRTSCTCSFPKLFSEELVFELLMKVFVQMPQAVSMWTTREQMINSFEKPFLSGLGSETNASLPTVRYA